MNLDFVAGRTRRGMAMPQRLAVTGSAVALLVSGLGWLYCRWLLRGQGLEAGLPHPAEAWWLRLHGAALLAGLVALGSLLPGHVAHGLRQARNRTSGIAALAGATVLALTGYGLYYLTADDWRAAASTLHWLAGLAVAPVLVLHMRAARQGFARQHSPATGSGRYEPHPG